MPRPLSIRSLTGISLVFLALLLLGAVTAHAQGFQVIYNFNGYASSQDGLLVDNAGNFYGTHGGVVYALSPQGEQWNYSVIDWFDRGGRGNGFRDGSEPGRGLILGTDGALYGTTFRGGSLADKGTVFKLTPQPSGTWTEELLYSFGVNTRGTGFGTGALPSGDIVMDRNGNIFGTTYEGYVQNCDGCGVVWELSPSAGGWTEKVLYGFNGRNGAQSSSGVIADAQGNLFGTTSAFGADDWGTVFEVSPSPSGWAGRTLHAFDLDDGDGVQSRGGLIFDNAGVNLYGATDGGGHGDYTGGTIFEVSPNPDGSRSETVLYLFGYSRAGGGCGPWTKLTIDSLGNLYGTTYCNGAYAMGNVFKLTRLGDTWSCMSLHDFTGGADGGQPSSNLVLDSSGDLYGTTNIGGTGQGCEDEGCGVIFRISAQQSGPACLGRAGP